MTDPRRSEELNEVELPAAALLEDMLGYTPLDRAALNGLRDSEAEPVLTERLREAVRRLNPWLDSSGEAKVINAVTRLAGVDLTERNQAAHVAVAFGVTAPHTDENGRRKDRTARLIDFDNLENNTFEFARQVRVKGARETIIPDLVVYVNGLPLAVIECKAPSLADPIEEAITQFRRYQGEAEFSSLGAPRLFENAHIHVALSGTAAKYGTTNTPPQYWAEWNEPYPLSLDALKTELGKLPRPQELLLASMFRKESLLELMRTFVVYEIDRGVRIKKIARYQQFIAVERAVKRILGAERPDLRGGVIFHTQGSGKSLTMVFLASRLRRLKAAENPTIVIVTDRSDLDDQISGTFDHCQYPDPIQAESGEHLREVLATGGGPTVMTTIHKFHTAVPDTKKPITTAENVFVLADEAHRTQYSSLAARMRAGLPKACMIAFTGTPIDKRDRSTRQVFGDEIHRYTIDQAVRDGATVPIHYEMRDARLRIEGRDLERELRAAFPELDEEQLRELKKQTPVAELVAGLPSRIDDIAADLLDHFATTVDPNGFKAQLVAISREAAVTYHEAIQRLGGPESAVIMSGSQNDTAKLKAHHTKPRERDQLITRFKDPADPLKIIVVCDMLLTGFDAPIEQVMYLDAPLREHTLLQAIARVNRTATGPSGSKTHGLVVDYWGDNTRIAEALDMFSEEDVAGVLSTLADRISLMHNRHRTAMRYFDGVDRTDAEACIAVLASEDVRAAFDMAFRRFAEAVDMVLPDPAALEEPYHSDLAWLAGIRAQARARYRDERLKYAHYGAKVRELVEASLKSDGVEKILAPVSILSPDFQRNLASLSSDEARASEMEHAIRHEIHVHRDENPAVFSSLWERLEQMINDRRTGRVSAAAALDELSGIAEGVRGAVTGSGVGCTRLSGTPGAILGLFGDDVESDQERLATAVTSELEKLAVIDWNAKEDVKRQMRRTVKGQLREAGLAAPAIEKLTAQIMDVARARMTK
ncbi:type I restriction endonuclease subunit R [Oceanicaulis sp.]|uniref:type I restriction endonuclease subunit R n=1 Tax=Oceanicaulis sp. TaxID=1924941 RepID=UPI003BA85D6C